MKLKSLLVLLVGIAFLAAPAFAAEKELGEQTGTVTIEFTSISAGVSVDWGSGILKFKGKEYPFSIKGIKGGISLGASKLKATGEVYNLKKVDDFDTVYTILETGAAMTGPATGLQFENRQGVIIRLKAEEKGLRVSGALGQIKISFK